jgi:mono/diheme cytochrome c family protein
MRRLALIAVASGLLLAGCGSGKEVQPLPETVVGTVAQTAKGDPAAGKKVYDANGCGSCHTYKPAGSNGTVGPDLDNLAADAQKANQGTVEEYVHTSVVDPNAYVVPGFPKGVMPAFSSLSDTQIADLVAFLTQKS